MQRIGQALRERTVYDEHGENQPLGAKGCGEAGCAGALPSVMNALVDALAEYGVPPHRHAGHARARLGAIRAARAT